MAQPKLPRSSQSQTRRRNREGSGAVVPWFCIALRATASTIKASLTGLALLVAAGVATAQAPTSQVPTSDDLIAVLTSRDIALDAPPDVAPMSDPVALKLTVTKGNRSYHSHAFPLETKAVATRRPDGHTIYHLALSPSQKPELKDFFMRAAWHAQAFGRERFGLVRAIASDFCRTSPLNGGSPLLVQALIEIKGQAPALLTSRDLTAEARAAGKALNTYIPACGGG